MSEYSHLSEEELEAKRRELGERNEKLLAGRYESHLPYEEHKQFQANVKEGKLVQQEQGRRRRSRQAAKAYYNEYQLGGMKITDSKRMREDYKRNNPGYRGKDIPDV